MKEMRWVASKFSHVASRRKSNVGLYQYIAEGVLMRVGINATALLSPRTGIGQYIYNLGREFIDSESVQPRFLRMEVGWQPARKLGYEYW